MRDKVGLFGGSFNPIHIGHLMTARSLAETLGFSRVLLIPCARPPHKWAHELASMSHRLDMARLACAGEPWLQVSDVETREDRMQYPIHTIEALHGEFGPSVELHWIIGCDAVSDLSNWHRLTDMLQLCRITVATRAGVEMPPPSCLEGALTGEQIASIHSGMVPTPQIEISATQIRQRVQERRSIRYWVPETVCNYIADRGLYRQL